MSDAKLHVEHFCIPLSRPTTKFGVNFEFICLSLMCTSLLYITTRHIAAFLVYIPLHAIGYKIAIKDAFLVPIFFVWMNVALSNRNNEFWKARSYAP